MNWAKTTLIAPDKQQHPTQGNNSGSLIRFACSVTFKQTLMIRVASRIIQAKKLEDDDGQCNHKKLADNYQNEIEMAIIHPDPDFKIIQSSTVQYR